MDKRQIGFSFSRGLCVDIVDIALVTDLFLKFLEVLHEATDYDDLGFFITAGFYIGGVVPRLLHDVFLAALLLLLQQNRSVAHIKLVLLKQDIRDLQGVFRGL